MPTTHHAAAPLIALLATLALPAVAAAEDTWTEPFPGIRHLTRTLPGPQVIHAAVVDLNHTELYIRATRPDERGQTTTAWARNVGAAVAINGDFFNAGYQPVGLAVGSGAAWDGTGDRAWSFIACNVERGCLYDDFTTDRALDWRWFDVVGGNGWRLLVDGNIPDYPQEGYYRADRHPRSAVGTSQDGRTMIFMVVQGRRGDSAGMTYIETATQLRDLGAFQGLMLDGGGSSALVIGGNRVSNLPTGSSERVVANHLAIVGGQHDARCDATPNGRYCTGTVIHTCQGGQHTGEGDCAFFGASCGTTSDGVGVCVHPFCANGPERRFCASDTLINQCTYGRPGEPGDCAFFGASCEDLGDEAFCVHPFCTEGGDATWCKSSTLLGTCRQGMPLDDLDCAITEQVCSPTLRACVNPDCLDREDATFCDGARAITCAAGVATVEVCTSQAGCAEGACLAEPANNDPANNRPGPGSGEDPDGNNAAGNNAATNNASANPDDEPGGERVTRSEEACQQARTAASPSPLAALGLALAALLLAPLAARRTRR